MRAWIGLLALSSCNFLTADLEDQAPVRSVSGPESSTSFGVAVVGLEAGTCGTAGALVVGGFDPNEGPRLYLVTFGESGGSTRSTLNDANRALAATEEIVALRPGTRAEAVAPIRIETTQRTLEVELDSDCDRVADEICNDFCAPIELDPTDPDADLTGNVDVVDLLGDEGKPVIVEGSSGSVEIDSRPLEIPDGVDDNTVGLSVAGMPFDGPGGPTVELAVGGRTTVLL